MSACGVARFGVRSEPPLNLESVVKPHSDPSTLTTGSALGSPSTSPAATTPQDVRVGLHGDAETCYRCGGENVRWCAPSPLWNRVMRGNDISGEPQFHDLVCVRCFIVLAFEAGVDGTWRLSVTPEPDGLIYETPSGRIWDADSWLWVDPADTPTSPGSGGGA